MNVSDSVFHVSRDVVFDESVLSLSFSKCELIARYPSLKAPIMNGFMVDSFDDSSLHTTPQQFAESPAS